MRTYHHPTVGDYYKRGSFEWDYALGAGAGGLSLGAILRGLREKKSPLMEGITSLGAGLVGGAVMPKRILSWFDPPPFDAPVRYPRQIPKKVVPSFIGESGQRLNLLAHHGAGSVLKDYSGYGNHGAITTAVWTDGPFGWALYYDGTGGITEVNHQAYFTTEPFTVEFWMYINTLPSVRVEDAYLARKRHGVLPWSSWWISCLNANDFLRFGVIDAGSATHLIDSDIALLAGRWYHVICELDAAFNMDMWINSVHQAAARNSISIFPATDPLCFGSSALGLLYRLDGAMTHERFYNRTLTQAEIDNHFESTRAIFGV